MLKYLLLKCNRCHSEMDFVCYKDDDFSFGVFLRCRVCDVFIPVECIFHGSDFSIVEWEENDDDEIVDPYYFSDGMHW